ncbi:MAG: aromatic ring-hydroxylating dioxygenase subunit alpha [Cyanobacteriota bacterium]|nr:aromatic ring-hydroxylating dioxygenase subunit alpha [Cyanobacteriota bacterium]
MFEKFANFWTPVISVEKIKYKPVGVELAGENLVLFRNLSGEIGALLDKCPHRGVALSLGNVNDNGCLECPYHGWEFDNNGNCTKVPFNNPKEIDLTKLSAVSLPTRIIAGLVWVFTGFEKTLELQIPESLKKPQQSYYVHDETWNVHWTRVIENAMDFVHLPFVHRNSFGGAIGKQALEANSVAEYQIEQTESSIKIFNRFDNIPSGFALEWYQPNLVVLKFDEMGIPVRVHLFSVPINEQQTQYVLSILMLGETDEKSKASLVDEFIKPVIEDKIVIESQIGEIPKTTEECNVPTDKATLLFRRWYHR